MSWSFTESAVGYLQAATRWPQIDQDDLLVRGNLAHLDRLRLDPQALAG